MINSDYDTYFEGSALKGVEGFKTWLAEVIILVVFSDDNLLFVTVLKTTPSKICMNSDTCCHLQVPA